jgi:hypothetical protein
MLAVLKRVALLGGSMLFALLFVECAARYRNGDSLLTPRLRSRAPALPSNASLLAPAEVPQALFDAAAAMASRPGIDVAWFRANPPDVPRRPVDPGLKARYEEFARRGVHPPQSYYVWNAELVKAACSSEEPVFREFPRDVKEFTPADHSRHPAYRFPANQTLPDGLVTNQFGFRGPALAPKKDSGLIRIAFVGASTTQNLAAYRWSYPELAGHWLNLWLQHQHRRERVEVINAGREGISSTDIVEVVRRELLPLQPDYVVYSEGANLMGPPPVQWPGGQEPPPSDRKALRAFTGWLVTHSAFAKAMEPVVVRASARPLDEPSKPKYRLDLPDPEHVTGAQLAAVFGQFIETITSDLDQDRRALNEIGARFVLTPVIRLVHDGLLLDPASQAATYKQLTTLYQPLTYADIRRLVDLQNAAYRVYAADHGVEFIDVATAFPRDPSLFFDSFHLTEPGVRLHAWLAFVGLTAILERDFDRLAARPVRVAAPPGPPDVRDARLPSCTPPPDEVHTSVPIELSILKAERGQVRQVARRAEVVTEPRKWSFGATLAISLPSDRPGPVWLETTLEVSEGVMGLGLLDAEKRPIRPRRSVSDTDGLKTISFRIEPDEKVAFLVFQTGDEAVAARADINAVTLVRD